MKAGSAIPTVVEIIRSYKRALKVQEVADLLSIKPNTVYAQAKLGLMPSVRIGVSVRFDPNILADWYERQLVRV
jgi:excisionase family DNA binding protein